MSESWLVKEFQDLTLQELYEMLRLRNEVFVVEQKCVFQDADAKDYVSIHIMCWSHYENENRKLIGYIRLLPTGVSYYDGFASIGRLVTHSSVRKSGLGKRLVARSLEELVKRFGDNGKKAITCFFIINHNLLLLLLLF
jgi:ElaA protein